VLEFKVSGNKDSDTLLMGKARPMRVAAVGLSRRSVVPAA
jgi:hypothetical protein